MGEPQDAADHLGSREANRFGPQPLHVCLPFRLEARQWLAAHVPVQVPVALRAPGAAAPEARPLSMMRRTIARRLSESKQTVPHFYLTVEFEIDALLADGAVS